LGSQEVADRLICTIPFTVLRDIDAYVTLELCARSDWHMHPLGQTLIVTFGCGLTFSWPTCARRMPQRRPTRCATPNSR